MFTVSIRMFTPTNQCAPSSNCPVAPSESLVLVSSHHHDINIECGAVDSRFVAPRNGPCNNGMGREGVSLSVVCWPEGRTGEWVKRKVIPISLMDINVQIRSLPFAALLRINGVGYRFHYYYLHSILLSTDRAESQPTGWWWMGNVSRARILWVAGWRREYAR